MHTRCKNTVHTPAIHGQADRLQDERLIKIFLRDYVEFPIYIISFPQNVISFPPRSDRIPPRSYLFFHDLETRWATQIGASPLLCADLARRIVDIIYIQPHHIKTLETPFHNRRDHMEMNAYTTTPRFLETPIQTRGDPLEC